MATMYNYKTWTRKGWAVSISSADNIDTLNTQHNLFSSQWLLHKNRFIVGQHYYQCACPSFYSLWLLADLLHHFSLVFRLSFCCPCHLISVSYLGWVPRLTQQRHCQGCWQLLMLSHWLRHLTLHWLPITPMSTWSLAKNCDLTINCCLESWP